MHNNYFVITLSNHILFSTQSMIASTLIAELGGNKQV
jgi:hypothetical protein